jgi:general transcription factor 3C polypeptide 3 (transcription factor C subunit 4)
MAQPQPQYPDPEMNEMLDRPWIGPQGSFQDESVNEYFGDADSDLREFEASIANIEEEVLRLEGYDPTGSQDFSTLMRSRSYSSTSRASARQRIGQQRRHGPHRGPRKAAEPTGDIKLRLGHATEAFIAARYVDAALIIADIIRINAETHEAWSLLHSVFRENNDIDNALKALIYAAHLRPKHTSSWYQCAQFALEGTGSLRSKYLLNAEFCYAAAIRADPANLDARHRKAAVCIERGKIGPAISDYKVILSRQPHDRDILRRLAELYIDQDEASTAIDLYRESITHFKSSSGQPSQVFDWTDLDTYVTLYEHDARYDIAIQQLRSLARWLSGRGAEEFWDEFPDDDREWDSDDKRRTLVSSFNPEKNPVASYGGGLPLEFRIKFGVYRLHLGNREEAFVSSSSRLQRVLANKISASLWVARRARRHWRRCSIAAPLSLSPCGRPPLRDQFLQGCIELLPKVEASGR